MKLSVCTSACIIALITPALQAPNLLAKEQRSTVSIEKNVGAQTSSVPKTIVITGAASGFGRGAAIKLAGQGDNLVLADINAQGLDEVVRQCGQKAIAVKADVTDQRDVEQLKQTALEKFGRIDVWINDAGIGAIGRFTDLPAKDQAKVIETNLTGVIYGSHCAVSQFEKQGTGTLINVSSIVGKIPVAYYSAYVASKMGIAAFDRALRAELKQDGFAKIRVCTIYPMPSDTPFWNHAENYSGHTTQPPLLSKPELVIDRLVRMVDHPKDEVVMSKTGKIAARIYTLHPKFVETIAARRINKKQIKSDAPHAPLSQGEINGPMPDSDAVHGGVRERMKSEKN